MTVAELERRLANPLVLPWKVNEYRLQLAEVTETARAATRGPVVVEALPDDSDDSAELLAACLATWTSRGRYDAMADAA